MGVFLTLPDEANSAVAESHYWHFSLPPVEPVEAEVFINHPFVSERKVTPTRIICGDCAGDGKLPRKTFMTQSGTCDGCGGQAFVLAVNFQFEIELNRRMNEFAISSIS